MLSCQPGRLALLLLRRVAAYSDEHTTPPKTTSDAAHSKLLQYPRPGASSVHPAAASTRLTAEVQVCRHRYCFLRCFTLSASLGHALTPAERPAPKARPNLCIITRTFTEVARASTPPWRQSGAACRFLEHDVAYAIRPNGIPSPTCFAGDTSRRLWPHVFCRHHWHISTARD